MLAFTDSAGVQAIPLISLLRFLMGLILAVQSGIPLRRFGADIYVVNLVTISLLRELGPLLAAVLLAGRTGSAFAAELGTMVVNDEVAAIATMGIDPVTMLVLPRLMAALLVMPGLALLMEVAGLGGMTVVMNVLGYPLVAVFIQAAHAATLHDLVGGLLKACVFGAAVAMIGCRTGLGAGLGQRAVGPAATAAVGRHIRNHFAGWRCYDPVLPAGPVRRDNAVRRKRFVLKAVTGPAAAAVHPALH